MEDPFRFVEDARKLVNSSQLQDLKEARKIKAQLRKFSTDPEKILLLTRLWHTVSPSYNLNCHKFIQCGYLYGPIYCLSSENSHIRAIANCVIQIFYCHLENSQDFVGRDFWIGFLDNIRLFMKVINEQLPNIVTSFLAHAIEVLIEPSHRLHSLRQTVVMFKKTSDIWRCLKSLLQSADASLHDIHTQWSLKIIGDVSSSGSSREIIDMLDEGVIDLLIKMLSSSLTSIATRIICAEIIEKCTLHEDIAMKLCLDTSIHSFMLVLAIDFSNATTKEASHQQLNHCIMTISKNIQKYAFHSGREGGIKQEDQEMKSKRSRMPPSSEIDCPMQVKDIFPSSCILLDHISSILESKN